MTRRSTQIIQSFEAQVNSRRSISQKLADTLTSYFGSINFLIINIILFVGWIAINTGLIPGVPIIDPYPFVLLITMVSLEAIILTVIVLMSQKRESQVSTLRDELQLQVELIAEREISKSLGMLKLILDKKGIKLTDDELSEMLEALNTSYITKKLEEQLDQHR